MCVGAGLVMLPSHSPTPFLCCLFPNQNIQMELFHPGQVSAILPPSISLFFFLTFREAWTQAGLTKPYAKGLLRSTL